MSYMMRDRPDGQFEIVLTRPILVGIFPEREIASRVMLFLSEDEMEMTDDAPASFGQALRDAAAAEADTQAALQALIEAPQASPPLTHLPAVRAQPKARSVALVPRVVLTEAQQELAFARITAGEKIGAVAPDFGLSFQQLRGLWANQCRKIQAHLAEGGQVPCKMCSAKFIPSLSHPDTCARCSRD